MNHQDLPAVQIFDIDITDVFKPLFTVELWSEIEKSFSIMEEFELPDMYDKYTELMAMFDEDETDTIKDKFYNEVLRQTQYILQMHSVSISKTMPLASRNELCEFFINIQHLQDYDAMYSLFTGTRSNEEILLELLEEHTSIPGVIWLTYIESFEPILIDMLKDMVEQKMGIIPVETDEKKIAVKAKALINMSVYASSISEDALGVQLATMQMLLGMPLSTYISLTKENLLSNPTEEGMALDFLSICLISSDMDTNPYTLWSQANDTLTLPLSKAMKISNIINDKFTLFQQHMKVYHEQVRVS